MVSKSNLMSRDAQTDRAFRDIVTKEKAELQAKSARLKALRLARDAEEAAAEPAPQPDEKKKPVKATKRRSFA